MSIYPSSRDTSLLLRPSTTTVRDSEFAIYAATATPTSGSTPNGDLGSSQSALCLVIGASDGVMLHSTSDGGTTWTPLEAMPHVADPGDASAIPVDGPASIALTIGAGAETGTLADPSYIGQTLTITADTVGGGSRAITAASAIDQAGDTVMTFAAAADSIGLIAVATSASKVYWKVIYNDGVALS